MTACYFFEGDKFLSVLAYDKLSALDDLEANFNPTVHMPNTRGIITMLEARHAPHDDTPLARQGRIATRLEQAYHSVRPALAYYQDRLADASQSGLARIKSLLLSCRLCNPYRINHIDISLVSGLLRRFQIGVFDGRTPADKDAAIARLLAELAAYRAAAALVNIDETQDHGSQILFFWRQHTDTLLNRASLAFNVALFQPSSAGVERIFSMLEALFNDTQTHALEDYCTAAIMPRYNTLQRLDLANLRRQ